MTPHQPHSNNIPSPFLSNRFEAFMEDMLALADKYGYFYVLTAVGDAPDTTGAAWSLISNVDDEGLLSWLDSIRESVSSEPTET